MLPLRAPIRESSLSPVCICVGLVSSQGRGTEQASFRGQPRRLVGCWQSGRKQKTGGRPCDHLPGQKEQICSELSCHFPEGVVQSGGWRFQEAGLSARVRASIARAQQRVWVSRVRAMPDLAPYYVNVDVHTCNSSCACLGVLCADVHTGEPCQMCRDSSADTKLQVQCKLSALHVSGQVQRCPPFHRLSFVFIRFLAVYIRVVHMLYAQAER